MFNIKKITHFFLALSLFAVVPILSISKPAIKKIERIIDFHADITIKKDGTLDIKETITVESTGNIIKHGIVRELPWYYTHNDGTQGSLGFCINGVLKNRFEEAYEELSRSQYLSVYLGSKKRTLKSGIYTYVLDYTVYGGIDFSYTSADELYWNVTGDKWRLPIEVVTVSVHLPQEVNLTDVKSGAYTGYYGAGGTDYKWKSNASNTIMFKTSRALRRGEGLTIRVCWPKGVVQSTGLSWWETINYYYRIDYGSALKLIFLLGLFLILALRFLRCILLHKPEHVHNQNLLWWRCGLCKSKSLRGSMSNHRYHGYYGHRSGYRGSSSRGGGSGFSGGGRGGGGGGGW